MAKGKRRRDRRKARKKKTKHAKSSVSRPVQRKFVANLREDGLTDEGSAFVVDPPGAEKMSVVIEEFAQPLLENCQTPEEWRKAFTVAIVGWNYALLDEAGERGALQEVLGTAPGLDEEAFHRIMEVLVERKRKLFPHINRFVVDHDLRFVGGNPYLSVASSLDPSATDTEPR